MKTDWFSLIIAAIFINAFAFIPWTDVDGWGDNVIIYALQLIALLVDFALLFVVARALARWITRGS